MFWMFFIILFIVQGNAINVRLIIPKFVRAGSTVTLVCQYDLGGKNLYSVKWYRGQHEFFRYVPKMIPSMKAFSLSGLNVDVLGSSAHQVTLLNVPRYISGKICCEVSADDTFSTAFDSANLTVLDMGIRKPILHLSSNILRPDTPVQINCSAQVTDPPPSITFYIEDDKVDPIFVNELEPGLASLSLPKLEKQILEDTEYVQPIWIRCEAAVKGIYQLPSSSIPIIPQPVPASEALRNIPKIILIILGLNFVI